MLEQYLSISSEVSEALANNKPVVALESTIISHGMPYPKNVETALAVEEEIRKNGAVPATIAIIEGRLKVGLNKDEISILGKAGKEVKKVSRRDIPFIVLNKKNGATTVAATMILAEMAGIKVFATGGIGGVHREAHLTMDISADLQELAKTNVAVVCAGIKSILDLTLTKEYLETHGVPIIGYKTSSLPAFYTQKSSHDVDYKLSTPEDIALAIKIKWDIGLKGGMVIANPIPNSYAMEEEEINAAINTAIIEMNKQGIKGKESTPFLLSKVCELTNGNSLESNIQLILNNARLGAKVAKEYSYLG